MARNKYLNDSVRLAQLIQKHMDKVFPRKSRGLRDAHVLALEGLSIPAVVACTLPKHKRFFLEIRDARIGEYGCGSRADHEG